MGGWVYFFRIKIFSSFFFLFGVKLAVACVVVVSNERSERRLLARAYGRGRGGVRCVVDCMWCG